MYGLQKEKSMDTKLSETIMSADSWGSVSFGTFSFLSSEPNASILTFEDACIAVSEKSASERNMLMAESKRLKALKQESCKVS
jgi:hypothetical protein